MRQNVFRGLGVALVTPFCADGSVDYTSLEALVNHCLEGQVDFLCVLGTTGETPCLSLSEKREVTARIVAQVGGRIPLLLGCGGNNTAEVVRFLQEENLEGIDGVLIVTPYYNKPTQEGLFRHYCAVAQATDKPVVLYNVPGRTGVNLEAATVIRIAEANENVVAVKEASGKLEQIREIISNAPAGFELLSGDDNLTLDIIEMGGVGVISVIGNAYPAEFGRMVHAALSAEKVQAQQIYGTLCEMLGLMTVDGNPAGVKALLSVQGRIDNVLRLPLVPAREETIERLRKLSMAI